MHDRSELAVHVCYSCSLKSRPESFHCPHCPEQFITTADWLKHATATHNVDLLEKKVLEIGPEKLLLMGGTLDTEDLVTDKKAEEDLSEQDVDAEEPDDKEDTDSNASKGEAEEKTEQSNTHTKTPQSMTESQFECPYCHKMFAFKRTMTRHVKTIHTNEISFECYLCDETFSYKQKLSRHIRKVHGQHTEKDEKKPEVAVCPYCGVMNKNNMSSHLWVAHGIYTTTSKTPRTWYQCDICGQRSNSKINHQGHMNTHTGHRNFKCSKCDAAFKQASCLRKHMKLHSGKKEFICDLCGREFARKEYLQQHLRLHSGEKPYKCHLCDKGFPQKTSLNVHLRSQHDVIKPRSAARPTTLKRVPLINDDGEQATKDSGEQATEDGGNTNADSELACVEVRSSEKEMAAAEILCNMESDLLPVYQTKDFTPVQTLPRTSTVASHMYDGSRTEESGSLSLLTAKPSFSTDSNINFGSATSAAASINPLLSTLPTAAYQNIMSTNIMSSAVQFTAPTTFPHDASTVQYSKEAVVVEQRSNIVSQGGIYPMHTALDVQKHGKRL